MLIGTQYVQIFNQTNTNKQTEKVITQSVHEKLSWLQQILLIGPLPLITVYALVLIGSYHMTSLIDSCKSNPIYIH